MPTVCVRVTEGEKQAWEKAAGGKRMLSAYVRATLNERTNGTTPQEHKEKTK